MKNFLTRILIGFILLCSWQISFAEEAPQPVRVTNFKRLSNLLYTDIYTELIKFITKNFIGCELDSIPKLLENEKNGRMARDDLKENLASAVSASINMDFSDKKAADDNIADLIAMPAGDDNPSATYKSFDYFKNIFSFSGPTEDDKKKQEDAYSNDFLNADNFIGTLQYSDEQQKSAQTYYRFLTASSQLPEVIRLGLKFYVPYAKNDPLGGRTLIELPNKKALEQLKKDLSSNADYRNYRIGYRTGVALRTMYRNNLLNAYYRRVPVIKQNGTDKSLAQLEHEQIFDHFKDEYYTRMTKATPPTVQFEILMALHTMNAQLFYIRQNQETNIVMQSVKELQSLAERENPTKAQQVGKIIYCLLPEHRDEPDCKAPSGGAGGMPSTMPANVTSPGT